MQLLDYPDLTGLVRNGPGNLREVRGPLLMFNEQTIQGGPQSWSLRIEVRGEVQIFLQFIIRIQRNFLIIQKVQNNISEYAHLFKS